MRVWGIAALISVSGSLAAVGQTAYDGIWTVTVLTKAGSCEPIAQYAVTVTDGKISGPQNVSGFVSREDREKVSIGSAYANGKLGGIPCSGRWEASRQ